MCFFFSLKTTTKIYLYVYIKLTVRFTRRHEGTTGGKSREWSLVVKISELKTSLVWITKVDWVGWGVGRVTANKSW